MQETGEGRDDYETPRPTAAAALTIAEQRTANLIGALALAVVDRVFEAAESVGVGGASATAAVTTLFLYGEASPRALPVVNVERLRRILGLSHSATVRLVDRLTGAGLVARGGGVDGREVALRLTPTGRRAAQNILSARQRVLDSVIAALEPGEREGFAHTLERLLAAITGGRWEARNICRLCAYGVCARNPFCPVEDAATALGE